MEKGGHKGIREQGPGTSRAQAGAGPRHQAHPWGTELGYRKVLPFAEGFANLSFLNGN